jgi:hypothetical protein
MFEYFRNIFEDTLERIFDTCLESMQLCEVDKFRQPRVWIRREVPVVARTIPLREEFPGRIDSDFRKDCKQDAGFCRKINVMVWPPKPNQIIQLAQSGRIYPTETRMMQKTSIWID